MHFEETVQPVGVDSRTTAQKGERGAMFGTCNQVAPLFCSARQLFEQLPRGGRAQEIRLVRDGEFATRGARVVAEERFDSVATEKR
jgi:hypothetical protein